MVNQFDLLEADIDDPTSQRQPAAAKPAKAEAKKAAPAAAKAAPAAKPPTENVSRVAKPDKRKDFDNKRQNQRSDGRGRGRGRGGGRGGGEGGDRAPRGREYDRRSASGVPNTRNTQRREGGGAYNWGDDTKGLEGATADSAVAAVEESAATPKKEGAEGEPTDGTPAEPEEPTMTFAEFQEQQRKNREALGAPKVRQAGEGEKGKEKDIGKLKKKTEEEDKTVGRSGGKKELGGKTTDTTNLLNFQAAPIRDDDGGRGRGRGGRGGRGRGEGRGGGRGGRGGRGRGDRDEAPRQQQPRAPRGRGEQAPDFRSNDLFPSL